MNILVLEASTTSAKAMIYNDSQGMIDISVAAYPEEIKHKGTVLTDKVIDCVFELGRHISRGRKVDAISVCGTWLSLVVCDRNMVPKIPTYSWTYMGAVDTIKEIRRDHGFSLKMYKRTGCIPHSIYAAYRLHHLIKKENLNVSDSFILGQGSYMFYRLTGERVETTCMMSGGSWINLESQEYDDEVLSFVGIDKSQLGRLETYMDNYPLSQEAAALLGLEPGIPVIPAHPDGALNQTGALALENGIMTISIGTSGAIRMSKESIDLTDDFSTWCYISPENKYIHGGAISGATNCVDWYRTNVAGYMSFEGLEADIRYDLNNPTFLPFLYGERCPGWNDDKKGGFSDLTGETTLSDLYYSVLEGILMNIRQCYEQVIKSTGIPTEIKVSGGILKSKLWTQMLSDILQHEIICSDIDQASLLGGAILAFKSLRQDEDPINRFILSKDFIIYPNSELRDYYDERYKKYIKSYSASK